MEAKVIDNFLDNSSFKQLQDVIFSDIFPWFYSEYKVGGETENLDNFQFVHMFYYDFSIQSGFFKNLQPLLEKLEPKAIVKIKSNLLPKTRDIIKFDYHNDVDFKCTTGIFYLNTNNGSTYLENEKINSVENRIVLFDSRVPHTGTSCTDQKIRAVINFNFF